MLKALDTDGSGSISYAEFVGGFRLVDTKPLGGGSSTSGSIGGSATPRQSAGGK